MNKELIKLDDGRELAMGDLIQGLSKVLAMYREENEELRPKGEFYDAVTQTDDLIEMSKVAKILNYNGYGRNNLFRFLRNQGVLRKETYHDNEPYQVYVNRGYFKVVEQPVELKNGNSMISRKTVVTQKGMDYIRKLLNECG